jgi:phospholipid/cholesterol/gamma-HCH transport system substrate-binding protein
VTDNLGPVPIHLSETASSAGPVAPSPGRHFGARSWVRPVAGLGTVTVVAAIVALAVGLFRGSFTDAVPVTVLSARAGLVMNPDAKVKMRGVQVGKVASIESLPDGQAALHLAMDPSQLQFIPANVGVDIASSTVFGAKFVELVPPDNPSTRPLQAGQTLGSNHVTVEINTVFQQLTLMLAKLAPDKLNETLGALASALSGRGEKIGQTLGDLDAFLRKLDPSLPALKHDIAVAPAVVNAYADAAPDLVRTVENSTKISQTIVEEQHNLDAFLISSIGLAGIGNDVIGSNRKALTDTLHLLLPTTDLTSRYHEALTCGLQGIVPLAVGAPLQLPQSYTLVSFQWGAERYRYPTDLPKVAATGGPHCQDVGLPNVPFEGKPPYVIADIGSNQFKYGNQQLLINSDLLKQLLYGPIDGPPRNTMQIGQPG